MRASLSAFAPGEHPHHALGLHTVSPRKGFQIIARYLNLRGISGVASCILPDLLWDDGSFWGVDTGSNTNVIKVMVPHGKRRLLEVDE